MRSRPGCEERLVRRALAALGGEGTVGDVVVLAGLSSRDAYAALDRFLADGRAELRVSGSGEVVYRLTREAAGYAGSPRGGSGRRVGPSEGRLPASDRRADCDPLPRPPLPFDRKTLRLIRAREGVLSLAELVEHTGLPLAEARAEMLRLADRYGGEPHPSWDGHVVWAFPEVMTSAHGRFDLREPRPAWVRFEDPVRPRGPSHGATARVVRSAAGVVGSALLGIAALSGIGLPGWLAGFPSGAAALGFLTLGTVALSGVGILLFGRRLYGAARAHRAYRFRERRSLRRYALGFVFETALAGKGVVSLERTVRYLEARAGRTGVRRSAVEGALRELAREFDAPITEEGGDLFFGFRNVKRHFLASLVERRRLRLGRVAHGPTVFDSGDDPASAGRREIEAFDRELAAGRPGAGGPGSASGGLHET